MNLFDIVTFVAFFVVVLAVSLWNSRPGGRARERIRLLSWWSVPSRGRSLVSHCRGQYLFRADDGMAGSGAAEQGSPWRLGSDGVGVYRDYCTHALLPRFLQAAFTLSLSSWSTHTTQRREASWPLVQW